MPIRCSPLRHRWRLPIGSIAAALLGSVLLATPARADWTVVWQVSRSARGMDDDSHQVTVLVKGDRARFERSPTAIVLVDGASGRIHELDPGAKTYTVTVPGAQPVSPIAGMEMPREEASGSLQAEGGAKTVAGRPTSKYAATSTLTAQMSSVPNAAMPSLRAEGEVWVGEGDQPAPGAMAATLPLLVANEEEAGAAQQRMDRTIERTHGLDMEAMRRRAAGSLGTSMARLMQPISEHLVGLGRPVLAARIRWSLGPGAPTTEFVAEATSVVEATHDEALFTVPADYRRVGSDPGAVPVEAASGPVTPVAASIASFEKLVGVYSLPNGEVLVTREGDRLYAELGGRSREELVPAEGTRFRVGRQPAEMAFFANAEGRITHATLFTQGMEMRAPRVR